MLKTDKLLSMRKDFPEISEAAYLLYCLIVRRYEGTKLTNGNGEKYITLSGSNDPKKFFGWTEGKYKRYKKELVDVKLIKIVQKGNGRPAEVYLTYGVFLDYRRFKNSLSKNSLSKNDPTGGSKTTRQEGLKTTRLFKDKNEIEKRNERAEPQKASPRSLAPARSFGDLKSADLTPDEQIVLAALVALEPKYNNLKNVDRKKTFVEWCHVLTGNGYQEADMIQAVRDCYSDDRYKTFMASADQFLPFADEAKRQRIEMEESAYYVKLFGGTENE